jgi:hypothetical protein
MSTAYTLEQSTRVEDGTAETLKITINYTLAPATPAVRRAAYADLLGGIKLVRGRLVYQRPKQDPIFPWCYCSNVKTEGLDEDVLNEDETAYSANKIRMTATFEPRPAVTPDEETSDSPDTSESGEDAGQPTEVDTLRKDWDFSARNLTLPNQFMKWGSTKAPGDKDILLANDAIAATITLPQIDYVITRFFVRNKPSNAITTLCGRVNKKVFRLYGETYQPETLRLESAKATQRVTNFGTKCYEITCKWIINPIYDSIVEAVNPVPDASGNGYVGWNRIFNPRVCKWERIVWLFDPARGMYLYDEDAPSQTINGKVVKGFGLLFNPGAK